MTEFLLCMFANFNSTYMYNYFAWHFFFLRFRFALEMSFINVNSKNVSQTTHIKTHKSLDDEHTPGVFDVSLPRTCSPRICICSKRYHAVFLSTYTYMYMYVYLYRVLSASDYRLAGGQAAVQRAQCLHAVETRLLHQRQTVD